MSKSGLDLIFQYVGNLYYVATGIIVTVTSFVVSLSSLKVKLNNVEIISTQSSSISLTNTFLTNPCCTTFMRASGIPYGTTTMYLRQRSYYATLAGTLNAWVSYPLNSLSFTNIGALPDDFLVSGTRLQTVNGPHLIEYEFCVSASSGLVLAAYKNSTLEGGNTKQSSLGSLCTIAGTMILNIGDFIDLQYFAQSTPTLVKCNVRILT